MQEIAEVFREVKEKRKLQGKIYPLPTILVSIALSRLCGCTTIMASYEFLKCLSQAQQRMLGFRDRIPCYQRLRIILNGVDPESLEEALSKVTSRFRENPKFLKQLCIDGKSVCASKDANGHSCHFVSVYSPQERMTYAQKLSSTGGGEVTSAKALLKTISLKNTIVTGDAMFTQAELCKQIHEQGGYFLFPVLKNHATMYNELSTVFTLYRWPEALRQTHQQARAHGRWEKRSMFTMYEPFTLGEGTFTGIRHVGHAIRRRYVKRGKTTLSKGREDVYFITNLPPHPQLPEQMLYYSRQHWGIENLSHRYRDVVFNEDLLSFRFPNITWVCTALNHFSVFCLERYRKRHAAKHRSSLLSITRDFLMHFKKALRFLRTICAKK